MPGPAMPIAARPIVPPRRGATPAPEQRLDARWTWEPPVEDRAALEALAPAWRALLPDDGFFAGPDWVLPWFDGPGRGARPLVLVAREPSGRLAALLPLARTRPGVLETCGAAEGAAHLDVVAPPARADEAARGALAALSELPWRRLRLLRVAEGGALARAARPGGSPLRFASRLVAACPYAGVTGDWDAFLASLPKHQRHEICRQTRRFLSREGAGLRWVREESECEAAVEALFDLHARRFATLHRATVFRGTGLRRFHTAVAKGLAREGRLILAVLEDAGRAVGCAYGFRVGRRAYLFQTGIDPEFYAAGAGVVLRAAVLRHTVVAAGGGELDLLDGCYDWKLRWATGVRVILDLEGYPATTQGRRRHAVESTLLAARERCAALVRGPRCPGRVGDAMDPRRCREACCRLAKPILAGGDAA